MSQQKKKKKVFISFDFDNDENLRDLLVGQCKNNKTPFDMEDWSVKVPWDQSEWKEKCLSKIKKCNLVIVMVGEKTHKCTGVKAEIEMAHEVAVPVVGIKGYPNKECPEPAWIKVYPWTWENVEKLVKDCSL